MAERCKASLVTLAKEWAGPGERFRGTKAWQRFPTTRWSLIILILVYVPMAMTYSLLTRAYEADDEPAHVQYIEYIVGHDSLPRIAVANNLESHQLRARSWLATRPGNTGLHAPRGKGEHSRVRL